MGRFKVKLNRDRVLTGKQDTPMKLALRKRDKSRKFLPIRHHEAIPEEPVMEDMNAPAVRSANPSLSCKPLHSESVSHSSSPAVTSRGNTIPPVTSASVKPGFRVSPAGPRTVQRTLLPKALRRVSPPAQDKTSSLSSSSTESDSTFSSDDEEEDCYSSSASSSSSLPSPEIFRRESDVEPSPAAEDPLGLHTCIKNSTLLDGSHAESIHMHQPPNLSTIMDASSILAEKKCGISPSRGPEAEAKLNSSSLKPGKVKAPQSLRTKTPPELTVRRHISYKKKVWFKSPVISGDFEAKHTPGNGRTPHITTTPVRAAGLTQQNTPDEDTPRSGESSVKEEASGLRVSLKRPERRSPETAMVFDFGTESDRDEFFHMMRGRSVRLRSMPLFPLTAGKHTH
ncbi:uncharacterized protein LOC117813238 isoform X2 [Notolabrus celidotus]|uniref:uncharacterized protein LOC117813238 isoform X2 n=1 Tax=Notolabrus celidotus TaxID=1203425 RepID=UPI00148FF44A|nr:uncharacterized protein LOC117813238 isoform X2 [Notolabrus celidotus]